MRLPLVLALMAATALPAFSQEALRLDLGAAAPQATAEVPEAGTAPAPSAEPAPQVAQATPAPSAMVPDAGTQPAMGADNKDYIIACALIYQRTADMYRERGEGQKADGFLSTAYAYSQTADILYTQDLGAEAAYDAITQRMTVVSEALNREAQGYPNGDVGVINAWLGWCDGQGAFVQSTMDAYNAGQTTDPDNP